MAEDETTEETTEPEAEEPEVAEGEPESTDGAHVEAVGSGKGATGTWVYECSEGDYHSRERDATVAHIAAIHSTAKPAKAAQPSASRSKRK